jgi:hypothetical protein
MKKDEIHRVVKAIFKKIDALSHKMIPDFSTKDIQELLVEIKKLRAFFNLLDMEEKGNTQFKLSRKMKTFYGYIGITRNLQLHLEKVKDYFENSTEDIPISYIAKLKRELKYWKGSIKEFIDLHHNFYVDEDEIMATLPGNLGETSIEKFMDYTVHELQKLVIHPEDDETLYSMCRFLEDLFYNWTYVQSLANSLLAGLCQEQEIKSFIEILEIFNDKCIDITLLQTYRDDATERDEILLQKIIHTWKIQKQELKQIIYDWLDLIKAASSVKVNTKTSVTAGHV